MEVGVLGPLRIVTGEGEIEIRAAKERALVEQLALSAGRPVSVDALIDGLWGDEPPPTAVKTLQNYVARVRRVLPADAVVSTPGGYALAAEGGVVDAACFEDEVARAAEALLDDRPGVARRLLATALDRWRGDPVPDLVDHPAGEAAATMLHELRRRAEDDLADARLRLGEHAAAVADLEAAVLAEPLRERRWGQLMLALYRSGRQAESLRAYQRAHDRLSELGLAPGPELQRLEQAILDHADHLVVTTGNPEPEGPATRAPLPPSIAALAGSPIVGRRSAEAHLAAVLDRADGGVLQTLVITGEPGIGKTRLLGRAAQLAHAAGGIVLFGRCDQEPIAPYQPFVECLRWFARETPTGALRRAVGDRAAELARLSPDIGRRLEVVPADDAGDDAAARYLLFDAVTSFLEGRSTDRPVLLAVDDLQWADQGSRLLLRHIVRSIPNARVAIGATSREPDVAADLDAEVLTLGGLDLAGVAELLDLDLGDVGAADQARELHRASGGSPLFLREMQRHAEATGRFPAEGDIPPGIRQAVDRRLATLSAPTVELLGVASVAGPSFDLAAVAMAAGDDERDALDAVDEALAAHLVVEDPDTAGTLAFSHAIVRGALYDELSESRRTYLHGRIGQALLVRHESDPEAVAGELAYHLMLGAGGRPDPLAAAWCQAAGRLAAAQYAWESATERLAAAMALLPPADGAGRIELLVELASAERAGGLASPAKDHFVEAIDLARRAGDAETVARVVLAWASVPVDVRRELHEVIAALRRAADELPDADGGLRAEVLGRLAFSLGWANEPDAVRVSDDAVAMARRVGDRRVLARVLLWGQSTHTSFEAAAPGGSLDEVGRLAGGGDEPELGTEAAFGSLLAAVHRGDRDGATEALAAARDRLARWPSPDHAFRLDKAEGDLWLVDGDGDRAEARADELFALAGRVDLRNLWLYASSLLYEVRRWQGRLEELAQWFDRLVERGERVPKVGAIRVEVLAATGRTAEALDLVDHAVADGFADLAPIERPFALGIYAMVTADQRHAGPAAALYDALEPIRGWVAYDGDTGVRGAVDLPLGRLATELGRLDAAAHHLAEAHRLHEALRSPPLLAQSAVAEAELALAGEGDAR